MLLDKSGLRKKNPNVTTGGQVRKPRTEEEKKNIANTLFEAIRAMQSPEKKAERIRNELKSKKDGR